MPIYTFTACGPNRKSITGVVIASSFKSAWKIYFSIHGFDMNEYKMVDGRIPISSEKIILQKKGKLGEVEYYWKLQEHAFWIEMNEKGDYNYESLLDDYAEVEQSKEAQVPKENQKVKDKDLEDYVPELEDEEEEEEPLKPKKKPKQDTIDKWMQKGSVWENQKTTDQ